MRRVARCACGVCAITIDGALVAHAVCHCGNCKRRTGSAFGISAYFRKSDIVSTAGETLLYAFHNQHRNEDQERHFCRICGTTLYWYVSRHPEYIGVAGGCFVEGALGEPVINSSVRSKLPWVTLPDHWRLDE